MALRDQSPLIVGDKDFCFLDSWSVEVEGLLEHLFLAGPSCLRYGGAIVGKTIGAVTGSPVTASSTPIPVFVVEVLDFASICRCLVSLGRNYDVVGAMVFTILPVL